MERPSPWLSGATYLHLTKSWKEVRFRFTGDGLEIETQSVGGRRLRTIRTEWLGEILVGESSKRRRPEPDGDAGFACELHYAPPPSDDAHATHRPPYGYVLTLWLGPDALRTLHTTSDREFAEWLRAEPEARAAPAEEANGADEPVIETDVKYHLYAIGIQFGPSDLERITSTDGEEAFLSEQLVDLALFNLFYEVWPNGDPAVSQLVPTLHIMSTFTFDKLMGQASAGAARWGKAKRGRPGLFEKNYVFVPYNSMNHWSLYVICNLRHTILFMCSLGRRPNKKAVGVLQRWMAEVWANAHRDEPRAFVKYTLIKCKVPEQPNGIDCGLFVARNVKEFVAAIARGDDGVTLSYPHDTRACTAMRSELKTLLSSKMTDANKMRAHVSKSDEDDDSLRMWDLRSGMEPMPLPRI